MPFGTSLPLGFFSGGLSLLLLVFSSFWTQFLQNMTVVVIGQDFTCILDDQAFFKVFPSLSFTFPASNFSSRLGHPCAPCLLALVWIMEHPWTRPPGFRRLAIFVGLSPNGELESWSAPVGHNRKYSTP
ncbi:hypothetical protein LZ31DRAFT_159876 [Colletotrichum somersetense]|nr:hypothetical protein LZ31DRAFT_159876 [Colletotrichum somersetense]